MRALLLGIFFLGLTPLVTAQTGAGAPTPELEHQQLRDLLTSQAVELQATREQLRKLQQRLELLEARFHAQGAAPATMEIAVAASVPETRNSGTSSAAFD